MDDLLIFDSTSAPMKSKLTICIRHLHDKGHSPGTSTNYSFKDSSNQIWVTRSGIDKSEIREEDFILLDNDGQVAEGYKEIKPSAETEIHTVLYSLFPDVKVVLHSHSVFPIALTSLTKGNHLTFSGYEMQKGLRGINTHDGIVEIPIFDNSQDMAFFKHELTYRKMELNQGIFMIRKHGFYAWGENLFEAKRHLESFDYLCQCEWLILNK
jgi:methylthioribulose-1-phosphate dehydratase